LAVLCPVAVRGQASYITEDIDYTGSIGEGAFNAIALGVGDHPAVVYAHNLTYTLRYAERTDSGWIIDTIEPDECRFVSLAFDTQAQPHASFYSVPTLDLHYATRSSSGWMVETVDSTSNVGTYTSIKLDNADRPRISYRHGGDADLKYAERNGAWATEIVHVDGWGDWTSLALEPDGTPHVSYLSYDGEYHLQYATRTGASTWSTELVDDYVKTSTALVLDTTGTPCIAYYEYSVGDLMFARQSDGSWTIETITSVGDVGKWPSMALAPDGTFRISFVDASVGRIRVATGTPGAWSLETVCESPGHLLEYTSIALDDLVDMHVSHYDATSGTLRYTRRNTAPEFSTAGTNTYQALAPGGGAVPLMATDADGDVLQFTVIAGALPPDLTLAADGTFLGAVAVSSTGGYAVDVQVCDDGTIPLCDTTSVTLEVVPAQVIDPNGGDLWAVGGYRSVAWVFGGNADVWLSVDGGATFPYLLAAEIAPDSTGAGQVTIQVPQKPTRFAKVLVSASGERILAPFTSDVSDSFFTIEASVALLAFRATPSPTSGAELHWETVPGPEDLAGYRIERSARIAGDDDWKTVEPLVREASWHDPSGSPRFRYRLFAINRLGSEYLLGEADLGVDVPILAWPVPYGGGDLHVWFGTAGGIGGAPADADLSLFDVAGRQVATLASGRFEAGYRSVVWDGRDRSGTRLASGVYFLRLVTAGNRATAKVVVVGRRP
jgi:hypothetical protein